MQMAIISPTSGLERYSMLSNVQMCLYHVQDSLYWKFYRNRVKAGDCVILDCSAYEGEEFNVDKYIERIHDLEPSVVVVPDLLLHKAKESFRYSMGLHSYMSRKLGVTPEWMFVPQAMEGEEEDFIAHMKLGLDEGFQWIGLPRALVGKISKHQLIRPLIAMTVRETHPLVKVHALGFGGTVHELYYLDKAGVYSWDSSAPVWRGWNGYYLGATDWPDMPCEFDHPEPRYPEVVLHNLRSCNVTTQPR